MKKIDYFARNRNVAKARDKSWKMKLVEGKLDALLNPTKLKLLRVKKSVSQNDIAKNLNLSLSTYGAIERGKRRISEKRAIEFSKFFGTKVGELFKTVDGGKYKAI